MELSNSGRHSHSALQASNEKDDNGSNDPDGNDNTKIEVDGSENGGSNASQNGSWATNGSMLASEALKNGTSQLSALLTQGQNGHGGHGAHVSIYNIQSEF